jgi:hypothetical protein
LAISLGGQTHDEGTDMIIFENVGSEEGSEFYDLTAQGLDREPTLDSK